MVKIYVEEVMKCVMERLTKEYGLTEQQALKEIDICMEKLYVKWMQNEPIPELFKIPYLASPEEYGEAIAKAAREQYYR